MPESVTYQPKQDLWLALLRTARARGHLRSQWVTGAPEPAQTEAHRKGLDAEGWQYLLAVPASTVVFAPQPVGKLLFFAWRGQPSRPRWLTPEALPKMVQALAARLPRAAWHTAMVADGTHRPAAWRYAFIPVWECNVGEPGRARWLVLHRNRDRRTLTAYLSSAPATTALETLLRVSVAHRCNKTAIKRQQAAIGLNEYEVRSWRGWYHHMALSLLAGAFLLQQAREKPVAPVALAADEPWA